MNVGGAHNAGPRDAVASCTAANSSAVCSVVLTTLTAIEEASSSSSSKNIPFGTIPLSEYYTLD
jgi:hypothetical protein